MGIALILSPHLDDGALSCPGYIQRAVARGTRAIVATVFSKGDRHYSARREEDRRAVVLLGAAPMHLGFLDAPYRSPRYSDFVGIVFGRAREYSSTFRELANRLRDLDRKLSPDVVVAPLAAGNHVDHRLVRDAALSAIGTSKLLFYEDRPYAFVRELVAHVFGRPLGSAGPRAWGRYFQATYVRSYIGGASRDAIVRKWASVAPFPRRFLLRRSAGLTLTPAELRRTVRALECYKTQLRDLFAGGSEIHDLYAGAAETYYEVTRSRSRG